MAFKIIETNLSRGGRRQLQRTASIYSNGKDMRINLSADVVDEIGFRVNDGVDLAVEKIGAAIRVAIIGGGSRSHLRERTKPRRSFRMGANALRAFVPHDYCGRSTVSIETVLGRKALVFTIDPAKPKKRETAASNKVVFKPGGSIPYETE